MLIITACQKDTGFFFMPVSTAMELLSTSRCSELDIILDLWISTVYNDEQVEGSAVGPVVYIRNGTRQSTCNIFGAVSTMGISKATVGRVLKKLSDLEYLSLLTFPGRHGNVIYLQSYLSTIFQISDVMIDKEEVAMLLNIKLELPDDTKLGRISLRRNTTSAFQRAFQRFKNPHWNHTPADGKLLSVYKGFRALNVPNPNISYILYRTPGRVCIPRARGV